MDNKRRSKQIKYVMEKLDKKGSITSQQAFKGGITRLSAIILRLRRNGLKIKTNMISGKDRFGSKCQYAKYTL